MIKNFVRSCEHINQLKKSMVGDLGEDFVVAIALKMLIVYALPMNSRDRFIQLIKAMVLNSDHGKCEAFHQFSLSQFANQNDPDFLPVIEIG